MWLLFVPILLIIVLVFMLATLFAGAAWLIGAGWPWLLIGLGIWLFWHEDGRHRSRPSRGGRDKRRGRSERHPAPDNQAGRSPSQPVAHSSSQPTPLRQPELPIDVQVRVEQIRRKVDVLLGYADRFPPFSQDLYLVRQTASEYLPRTISAYLALPNQSADKPLVPDGKTAHQELKAQLDLLDSKLDDIAEDLQRQDADRLLANRRFLEARFGMRDARPFPSSNGTPSSVGAEVA